MQESSYSGLMRLGLSVAMLLVATAAMSAEPTVSSLAGRYSRHFRNGNIDGDVYWSDDVVEIVPIDATHAYFRISLHFFNGHGCSLHGVAKAQGSGLDYYAPPKNYMPNCHMTLSRQGKWLKLDDHEGTCQMTCGARGGYWRDGLPYSSKRPIRYMARLKASYEYQAALIEWRTGKPYEPWKQSQPAPNQPVTPAEM